VIVLGRPGLFPFRRSTLLGLAAITSLAVSPPARAADLSIPHLVHKDGRHALIVDGEPFLILGAQCNNSSAWPAVLPQVWSAMETLDVNTLEIPIYWEQFEPRPGQYDYSVVNAIITQARERDLRLVLRFATWKNGSTHYMPEWMKLQPERYPNIVGPDGREVDSPSPHSLATLEADSRAFTAFMRHLRDFDAEHTVIMVQVENEPGAWGVVRDHSPAAQTLFEGPVPAGALAAMGMADESGDSWTEAFGRDADEYFQVWHVARFIGQVAAAGKAVYPLPFVVYASIRDPVDPGWPPRYQVGDPTTRLSSCGRRPPPPSTSWPRTST
jgi:beta-galactosidase GanA